MTSKILYFGTDPSRYGRDVVHCPLIKIVPLSVPILAAWETFTHVILTSPNAVRVLARHGLSLLSKHVLAIGTGTAHGLQQVTIASLETQEGMIALLEQLPLQNSTLLYPRSSRARPLLSNYLKKSGLNCQICDLYDTHYLTPEPLPILADFEEIVFTSPSTVEAFFALYRALPPGIKITCLGPITKQAFLTYLQ